MSCGCGNSYGSGCGCGCSAGNVTRSYCGSTPTCVPSNPCGTTGRLSSAFKITTAWTVPGCDLEAVLTVSPALTSILIGSYIYNGAYGYFKITAFTSSSSQITVLNECISGNKPAGTVVPTCTTFMNTDPPASAPGSTGISSVTPYLALDFVVPAVSSCQTAYLTNVNFLYEGVVVNLDGGTYSVGSIIDATSVTLCNDGDGGTPGSTITAQSAYGYYQFPLTIIISNTLTLIDEDEEVTNATTIAAAATVSTSSTSLVFENTHPTNNLKVNLTVTWSFNGYPNGLINQYSTVLLACKFASVTGLIGATVPPTPLTIRTLPATQNLDVAFLTHPMYLNSTYTRGYTFDIAPGDELSVASNSMATNDAGSSSSFVVEVIETKMNGIAVTNG